MSGREYEDAPRVFKLTEGVRLDQDTFVFGVQILRGQVPISTEQVLMSIDDASVMNAQLSRLLNDYSCPGLEERREQRQKRRWS